MVTRREDVCWCRLLLATCLYLPGVCATSYTGTAAVQWTLYSGLKLSWNEASMFCKSLGGHLPVVNTKLKWNGFNATLVNWHKANVLLDDVWTGLFSQTPSAKPDSWEADCSLQPDGLDFWGPLEPNNLNTDLCIRYQKLTTRLCTLNCSYPNSIVCEFDQGSCRSTIGVSSLLGGSLATTRLNTTTAAGCWEQCLNYTTTGSGQDCVAAMFLLGTCTAYLGDTLLSTSNSTSQTLLTKTMFKECFQENTTNIYNNYIFVDRNSLPRPAGDPCSTNRSSFVPVLPVPNNTTSIQTTIITLAQTTWSGQTTTPTTKQQSSVIPETETISPTITEIIGLGIWATIPLNNPSLTSAVVEVTNSTLPYNDSTTSANSSLSTTESSLLINSYSLLFSNADLPTSTLQIDSSALPFNDSNLQTNGSTLQANDSTSQTNGSTLRTNGSTPQTNGSTLQTKGSTSQTNGSTLQTNGSTLQTNGSTSQTNGSALQTNGSTPQTNGSTLQANGSTLQTNGSTLQTNSSTLHINSSTKSVTSSTLPVVNEKLTTNSDSNTAVKDANTLGPEKTTDAALTLHSTDRESDVTTQDVSTSKENSSTKGFQSLLCPCMKPYPNSFATMETPIIHRSNTSKYRRSLNSEWGSPSVYTSTSSATGVIVVGVAGFLFVACDINRLMGLCNKKTPKKGPDTMRETNFAME